MSKAKVSAIGDQGLVIFDGDKYYFIAETQIGAAPAGTPFDTDSIVVGLRDGRKTVLVDIDALRKTPSDPEKV